MLGKCCNISILSDSDSKQKMTDSNQILTLFVDSPETVELFAKKSFTAEDRFKILRERDKILRDRLKNVKLGDETTANLRGTCPDMCPEKERYMREYQQQLNPYEIAVVNENTAEHHPFTIKKYTNSVDEEIPLHHELRPIQTLEMTMNYILHNIVYFEDCGKCLENWHDFVLDRTMAIRKEIKQQQICNYQAVSLIEKCTRFHILCSSRLSDLDRFSFDAKLNNDNLIKCLKYLEDLYAELQSKDVERPNEPEFTCYKILLNLNDNKILCGIQQKPQLLEFLPVMQAVKIYKAFSSKDFRSFFQAVKDLPYLAACTVHRYFFQVRSSAFKSIIENRPPRKNKKFWVSATSVQCMLGYGPTDTDAFSTICTIHGCAFEEESDKLKLPSTFYTPPLTSICRELYLIESKLKTTVAEAINGGPLGRNPYPSHVPQCSFDEEGYLIPGPIISVTPGIPREKVSPTIFPYQASVGPPDSSSENPTSKVMPIAEIPSLRFTCNIDQHAIPHPSLKASVSNFLSPNPPNSEIDEEQKFQNCSPTVALHPNNQCQDEVTRSLNDSFDVSLRTESVVKSCGQKITTLRKFTGKKKSERKQKEESNGHFVKDLPARNQHGNSDAEGIGSSPASSTTDNLPFTKITNITSDESCSENEVQEYSLSTCVSSLSSAINVSEELSLVAVKSPSCQRGLLKVKTKGEKKIVPAINPVEKMCNICNKPYKNTGQLNRHAKIHTGEKRFKCNICGKLFCQNSQLKIHTKIHSGDKPFSCEICQKKFSRKSDLGKHDLIHRGEKPYECQKCKKRFTQKSEWVVHRRIHTEEKPYMCDRCGKDFRSSSNLGRHRRTHAAGNN